MLSYHRVSLLLSHIIIFNVFYSLSYYTSPYFIDKFYRRNTLPAYYNLPPNRLSAASINENVLASRREATEGDGGTNFLSTKEDYQKLWRSNFAKETQEKVERVLVPDYKDVDDEVNILARGPDADSQNFDIPLGIAEEERNVPGEPLTPEDFQNAENLELLLPPQEEGAIDPLEVAGLFEGDIAGVNISDLVQERNAIKNSLQLWPKGIVPYVISASFSVYERSVIAAAFLDYHKNTCIKFVPRTQQRDYVFLLKGAGCSSYVGRNGNGQQVSLGPGCLYKGIVVHELMHAVGFYHEQSRTDRDQYVTILWQNIQRGMEFNFQKFSLRVTQMLGSRYDTGSVMHYGMYAFSRDHTSPTILPKQPGITIGQRRGFSEVDIKKINRLYKCEDETSTIISPPTTFKPDICADNHKYCQYWSKTGECRKNPKWMLINCAKSCKHCDVKCDNYNSLCQHWTHIGECKNNPDYMNIYCAKSCRLCTDLGEQNCDDHNKFCQSWMASGECWENPDYMQRYCKKSCNVC